MSSSLLERSLSYSSVERLDSTSRSLRDAGREYYEAARASLKADAEAGRLRPAKLAPADFDNEQQDFWTSDEKERFALANSKLYLFRRAPNGIEVFEKPLSLNLGRVSSEFRDARAVVDAARSRDLRRGFNATLILITIFIWLASFGILAYVAGRVSKPIRALASGLSELASGNFAARLEPSQNDEIGIATAAFNNTAAQLQQSRDRLVYLTQLASWQVLARKTAHEIKNSLTPIPTVRWKRSAPSWSRPRRSWWMRWNHWSAAFAPSRTFPPNLPCARSRSILTPWWRNALLSCAIAIPRLNTPCVWRSSPFR
jgi:HAMP domain-containing protein